MSAPVVVIELARAWHDWQQQDSFPFRPDHCINGTRVAVRTLERFGVRAHPVSVQFLLFNRFAWELYNAGVPVDDWPEHAWSLGVGPREEIRDEDHFDGHLVCEGEDWTLDISAGQFDRPGRIVVPGPKVFHQRLPFGEQFVTFGDSHGQLLAIARWPENNSWRLAGGWKRLHEAEVAELERRINERLENT